MKWLEKVLSAFSYGADSLMLNDVEPAVENYVHFTCVVIELLQIWKFESLRIATLFSLLFAFHFLLFFITGYFKGTTYGKRQNICVIQYQSIELCLIAFGVMVRWELMLIYVVFSYGLPYIVAQIVEFIMTEPIFCEIEEYLFFVLIRIVVWLPLVLFEICLIYVVEDNTFLMVIGFLLYFAMVPFVIDFEDEYASLYEVVFDCMV